MWTYAAFSSIESSLWYWMISSYVGCWLWSSPKVFLATHVLLIAHVQRSSTNKIIKIVTKIIKGINIASKVLSDVLIKPKNKHK